MDKSYILQIDELSKSFGDLKAVDNVSLKVSKGEVYALIGPNGSGKTTLINNIVGLLRPDKGAVTISGIDVQEKPVVAKSLFGFVPDDPISYPYLTGIEFLELTGRLKHDKGYKKRVTELIDLFPISQVLKSPMAGYSRGSLQKTSFLSSLLGQPKLLVIDEPVVGLDPTSINIFGNKLKSFAKEGGAVFFSTHTLSFAHKFADRLGIMSLGHLVAEISDPQKEDLEKLYERKTT